MKPLHKVLAVLFLFLMAFLMITGIEIGDTSSDCEDGDIIYYNEEWVCMAFSSLDTTGSGGGNFTLNISTDSGAGEILNNEILYLLGHVNISTSMSGNIVYFYYNGSTGTGSNVSDTNESIWVNNAKGNCTGTDKMYGVDNDGSKVCSADVDTDTQLSQADVLNYASPYNDTLFIIAVNNSIPTSTRNLTNDDNFQNSTQVNATIPLIVTQSFIENLGFTIATTIQAWIFGNWTDLEERKLNITDQRYNESLIIAAVNNSIPTSTYNLTNDNNFINWTTATNGTLTVNSTLNELPYIRNETDVKLNMVNITSVLWINTSMLYSNGTYLIIT